MTQQIKTFKLEQFKCPYCGTNLNAAAGVGECDRPPQPGDITICIKCGEVYEFGENLEGVVPSQEKQIEYMSIPEVNKIRMALALVKKG